MDTTLAPIKMLPAYRYGKATPWGGDALEGLFGRQLPDKRTGESLEISALSGLSSQDEEGNTLPELIQKHGENLVGRYADQPFPLLLKLISARDLLSVQVHPDDAYAKEHENKLGKTEAWIIVDCEKGAELVFGVKEGTSMDELEKASLKGAAIEKLLERVKIKPGDAFMINAGTLHAIGAGIVLYEIQQSSDVTYRFYDWQRTDKDGNKRPLHLKKALDVVDLDVRPSTYPKKAITPARTLLVECPYFATESLRGCDKEALPSFAGSFGMLTALSPAILYYSGEAMELEAGQTVFLASNGYDLTVTGEKLLLSYPPLQP